MGLTLSLVWGGHSPGTQGHAQIVAWLLQNIMCSAWSPHPICSKNVAGIPSSLGVGWNAVPGVGSWGVRPTLHSSGGRADCLSLSGAQQDSDLGLRKWSLAPIYPQTWQYHLCREYFSSVKRPADPGWLLLCPFWGVVIIPATTLGEWTPASQSQQEEGPKGKLRGRLSWGHSGSSMAGGWADGQAGRQAVWGRSLWSLANAGAYCRGFSRLTLAPALKLQVGMLRQAWPLPYSSPWATPCLPLPISGALGRVLVGGCGASLSLPGHLGGIGPANGTGPVGLGGTATHQTLFSSDLPPHLSDLDKLYTPDHRGYLGAGSGRLTFNHLSTHLAWNSWLQGRTRSSCRTSKSLKQTTHLTRSTVSPPILTASTLPGVLVRHSQSLLRLMAVRVKAV